MNFYIFLISLAFSLINAQVIVYEKPLKITVLYETLCGDSKAFFKNQLAFAYPDFKDYIDIKYVPFGKADSYTNGAYFACQHGLVECEGNKIQSCALNTISQDQDSQTDFTLCYMRSKSPGSEGEVDATANTCARSVGIPPQKISSCMNSIEGNMLQLKDEQITKSFYGPLKFVPTIVYDDQFDQNLQDESLSNFGGVICRLLHSKGITDSHLKRTCG